MNSEKIEGELLTIYGDPVDERYFIFEEDVNLYVFFCLFFCLGGIYLYVMGTLKGRERNRTGCSTKTILSVILPII